MPASYSPRHGEHWWLATNIDLTGVAQNSTVYFRLIGAGGNTSTESDVEIMAGSDITATKLIINVNQADVGYTVTLRKNGADTGLSITESASQAGTKSTTGSVSITEGDQLAIELVVDSGSVGDTVTLDSWGVSADVTE